MLRLEIGKVPPGRDEVGPHTLNSVYEHTSTFSVDSGAFGDNMTLAVSDRPETVDDVSFGIAQVATEVAEPALGPEPSFQPLISLGRVKDHDSCRSASRFAVIVYLSSPASVVEKTTLNSAALLLRLSLCGANLVTLTDFRSSCP